MNRVSLIAAHLAPAEAKVASGALTSARGLYRESVVVVTGSGQGIGRAAALLFAQEGEWKVWATRLANITQ